ncbi:hypothetical protein ACFLVZ_02870 [Chloroflexota bacterium]
MEKKAIKKVYDPGLCEECTSCPEKSHFHFVKQEGIASAPIGEDTDILFRQPACEDCDQPPCPNACPVKAFDIQDA